MNDKLDYSRLKYDFSTIIDRKGMDAIAYDAVGQYKWGFEPGAPKKGFDFIPMWVADMNFATCPAITREIVKRAEHPLFGYFNYSDAYYDAIISWRRPGHPDLTREEIGYENGVHGMITSAVQVLTEPGDQILLNSPCYVGFRADVEGLGRQSVYSPLKKDAEGVWRMDYEDMDRKIRENDIRVVIFCSPHNPTGRVWKREELEQAMDVFQRNDCIVISDEIWADIVFEGHEHIPTQMVNDWAREHVIAAYAPSKTFNLAGLVGSYHIIYNEELRKTITKYGDRTHYNEMNVLSMHALIGGYSEEGRQWLNELNQVLEDNARLAVGYIREHFDGVDVSMTEGTYMLFLDCTEFCSRAGETIDQVIQAGWDVGVGWQDGRKFQGPCHIRLNLASPRTRIQEALDRMDQYVFNRK